MSATGIHFTVESIDKSTHKKSRQGSPEDVNRSPYVVRSLSMTKKRRWTQRTRAEFPFMISDDSIF